MKKPAIPTSPASLVSKKTLAPTVPREAEEESIGSTSRDPSDPAVDRGVQLPTFEGDDEQEAAERLVERGVEEAADDQARAGESRRS
jgi:hypothetical protein